MERTQALVLASKTHVIMSYVHGGKNMASIGHAFSCSPNSVFITRHSSALFQEINTAAPTHKNLGKLQPIASKFW